MDEFDPALLPRPFGLENTGAICYLNSLLQSLSACTSFTRQVLANKDYLAHTATGRAVGRFVEAYSEGQRPDSPSVLVALVADLAHYRPHVHFGAGQESASEALLLLLDMMEGAPPPDAKVGPISQLFTHRFVCRVRCAGCREVTSTMTDYAVNLNLFHLRDDFARAVRGHASVVDDYFCEKCGGRGQAVRSYSLAMVPEILYCMFNVYGDRPDHPFPAAFDLPGRGDDDRIPFRLVAQVEHSGGLHGGHYWARVLRRPANGETDDVQPWLANDTSVREFAFAPSPETYIAVYHYGK